MRHLELTGNKVVADLALTPDGQTLAIAHRTGGIGLYDAVSGKLRRKIPGYCSHLVMRSDGRWLLGLRPGAVVVDLSPVSDLHERIPHSTMILSGEFPDAESVAVVTYDTCHRLKLPDRKGCYARLNRRNEEYWFDEAQIRSPLAMHHIQLIGIGPNGYLFGVEYDYSLAKAQAAIYNLALDEVFALAEIPNQPVGPRVIYRRSNDWFVICTPGELRFFNWSDLSKLTQRQRVPQKRSLFTKVRETLMGPSRSTQLIERYESLPILPVRQVIPCRGVPSTEPLPMAFHPDGQSFLCRGERSTVEWRELNTGSVRASWQFGRAWPRALAFAADGMSALAATNKGTIVFWDLE